VGFINHAGGDDAVPWVTAIGGNYDFFPTGAPDAKSRDPVSTALEIPSTKSLRDSPLRRALWPMGR
jgi:hypothetical protein